jgi:CTP-dependent riboflavin kinase
MSKMSDMSLLIEEPSYDYLEKHMNVSVSTIKRLLQALKNEEKIRRIGAKRGEM